jgi:hypothetical protein
MTHHDLLPLQVGCLLALVETLLKSKRAKSHWELMGPLEQLHQSFQTNFFVKFNIFLPSTDLLK